MRKAQEEAPARVQAEARGAASILRLAIASLTSDELRKWFAIWILHDVRRVLVKLPPPIDKLAWLGLPSAGKYNRFLIKKYHTESKQ